MTVFVRALPSTKRSMLRVLIKVFDPLGLLIISPFMIGTKILFQTLCKSKINWDDILDGTLMQRWNCLVKSLNHLRKLQSQDVIT